MINESRLDEWCWNNRCQWEHVNIGRYRMIRIRERDRFGGFFYDAPMRGMWEIMRRELEKAKKAARKQRAKAMGKAVISGR